MKRMGVKLLSGLGVAGSLLSAVMLGGCSDDATTMAMQSAATRSSAPVGYATAPASAVRNTMMSENAQPAVQGNFEHYDANPWHEVAQAPQSTFAVDVNTASYAFIRRQLREGHAPFKDAVRSEELINYFPYDYAGPKSKDAPFALHAQVTPTPWNPKTRLVHLALKGYDLPHQDRPKANFVFLLDVSGSMGVPDRLPLIQQSLHQLGEVLRPDDKVAIVTYAGQAGIAQQPTSGSDWASIKATIDSLHADGGTAGYDGLQTAYRLAESIYDPKAVNRVILATDGDFNVGLTDPGELEHFIQEEKHKGIYLTVLGVGVGDMNEAMMKRLARAGNGQAAYLDSLMEARKVWTEEMASTVFPIADDVKIQVEFNPARVAEYRLIGYEGQMLRKNDFSNDAKDAGSVNSGHSVTAIYEILPVEHDEPSRYAKKKDKAEASDELAFFRLRYKLPGQKQSKLFERPIGEADAVSSLDKASDDVRFSTAVAGFGQLLRGDAGIDWSYDAAAALAQGARGSDPNGWRSEFVQLVHAAQSIKK